MERSNQPTQTECCRREGQANAATQVGGAERLVGGVHRGTREPQAGVAPRLSNSASKPTDAGGQDVLSSEAEIRGAAKGEALRGLSGSKSVAREERAVRNQGDPENSRRTNYEGQAGRKVQRQEGPTEGTSGVGSLHSSHGQGESPDCGEGGDRATQSAQVTSTVRTTGQDWRTFRRARRRVALKSPVLENCTPGSVRGAPGNRRPYLDNMPMNCFPIFLSSMFLSSLCLSVSSA